MIKFGKNDEFVMVISLCRPLKRAKEQALITENSGRVIMRKSNQIAVMLTFLASRQAADEEMGRIFFFLKISKFNSWADPVAEAPT